MIRSLIARLFKRTQKSNNPAKNTDNLFENKYGMMSDDALTLIKDYFALQLSSFSLSASYNDRSGHWGIKYELPNSFIFITSDRGYLETDVVKDGNKLLLTEVDARVENIEVSSKKNILFVLEVLKRVFPA